MSKYYDLSPKLEQKRNLILINIRKLKRFGLLSHLSLKENRAN